MKNVLVFSNEYPPVLGGAGSVAEQNVSSLNKAGYSVTILTKKRPSNAVRLVSVKYKELTVFGRFWFLSYICFCLFNRQWLKSFDIILLNDPGAIYIAGTCFSRKALARCYSFMHGSEIENIFGHNNLIKRLQLFELFFLRAIRYSRKIIFPSSWLMNKFLAYKKIEHISSQSVVCYAGVDQTIFFEQAGDIRKKLGLSSSVTLLLSVSRVIEKKGYPAMYTSFKELHDNGCLYHWIVAGDGSYISNFKSIVEADGMSEFVHFVGSVSRNELRFFYSETDVFFLLSDFDEAFGLVYLEAAACGTPSIANCKGGVYEAINQGVSGFVVNSSYDCTKVLCSDAWRSLNKKNIQKHVEDIERSSFLSFLEIENPK